MAQAATEKEKDPVVPARVAVLVQEVDAMFEYGQYHPEVHTEDGKTYLLDFDGTVPNDGDLVVLRRLGRRPCWWKDTHIPKHNDMFGYHFTYDSIWLWEVVEDEDHTRAI